MQNLTSLFLSQSYHDTWEDYHRSLNNPSFATWDYVVLTASNDFQAQGYQAQIAERQRAGLLPETTHFAVVPDHEGKRVGSGGATLGVLKYIKEHRGRADFSGLRILVIHSGGDSKRVPQYSALGKLFSPVPHALPDGRSSTLFDEFIMVMSSVPSRIREGMLLLSGDVLLLFNPLQIDYNGEGAAVISFKEDVETGKNHGVFLNGEGGKVKAFLHKQSEETLREKGAVDEKNRVDIDTGAVIFSSEMLASLYRLVDTDDAFSRFVNERVRLSLYADFLYPLATHSTLEDFYKEKPEGEFCEELTRARTHVWELLRPYTMKLLRLSPAKFIHFGTTKEILKLVTDGVDAYQELGWSNKVNSSTKGACAGYNSVLSKTCTVGKNCYLEVSYLHAKGKIGDNVLLSYIDVTDETVPSNVVLHGLKQKDGRFVARIYGIGDNPKTDNLFGKALAEFVKDNKLSHADLWDTEDTSLWQARLYPACRTIKEAIAAALNLYDLCHGGGDKKAWLSAERMSLCSGFLEADPVAIIDWDKRMQALVRMDRVRALINQGLPARDATAVLGAKTLSQIQKEWLKNNTKKAGFSEKIRLYYYVGKALGGVEGERFYTKCFKTLQQAILENTLENLSYHETAKIAQETIKVTLPLRVNFGGGWTDTPPYCIEHGGTVLNCALLLDGKKPVEVSLEKIKEKKIVFDSRDMDTHREFTSLDELQATGDPYDPFALQKAALIACGILPKEGGELGQILTRLGGGFIMRSEVTGVPKGSGLGTSSILSAACVKAIFAFMDIAFTEKELYASVLAMEQIMSTGGGWQDQVGGASEGLKIINSKPGMGQELEVKPVILREETRAELSDRFALIYTGQRRLARNLLRDVVGRYLGNEPDSIFAHNEIQKLAVLMTFELERGNIAEFAELLNTHWQLSKKIDKGSSNTLIDQIFNTIEDLIDGKMVCGAGGGGFLQVIMKEGVKHEQLQARLHEVFADSGVGVWDATLLF